MDMLYLFSLIPPHHQPYLSTSRKSAKDTDTEIVLLLVKGFTPNFIAL